MKSQLVALLVDVLKQMGVTDAVPLVDRPADEQHGDYTTNLAMVLTKRLKRKPIDIANDIKSRLEGQKKSASLKKPYPKHSKPGQKISAKSTKTSVLQDIEKIEVVPPGFINLTISASSLIRQLSAVLDAKQRYGWVSSLGVKKVMVEFAHPNTHKMFHIGHLRNISTGEAIVRLLESQGNNVIRVNYQGDVGLHIAKCIYGLVKIASKSNEGDFNPSTDDIQRTLSQIISYEKRNLYERVSLLGKAYVEGNRLYETNLVAKKAIDELNSIIYSKDEGIYSLYLDVYRRTRQWSLDYFENIYKRVGTRFDRYYFEGEVFESGKKAVLAGLKKGIFKKSEGAVIFPGEKFGLHNRVFITRDGNATYEGKDTGLVKLQVAEYHPDRIIHVVASEQTAYFQVIFKAMEQLFPETKGKEYHLVYGWVRLKEGKMSSRTGNVVLGEWLLDTAKQEIQNILEQSTSKYTEKEQQEITEKAAIAAVKYAFLKVATTQEIAFDFASSISFDGDSGPYLQYTYARCQSVLRKAGEAGIWNLEAGIKDKDFFLNTKHQDPYSNLNPEERSVVRLLMYFSEVVAEAAANFAPNMLCTYLFGLAQAFNLFYQKHTILGDQYLDTTNFRLVLTAATAQVLHNGLYLLGIETLERM